MSKQSRARQREKSVDTQPVNISMPTLSSKQKRLFMPFLIGITILLLNGLFCFFQWFGYGNVLLSQCILAMILFLLAKEAIQASISRFQYTMALLIAVSCVCCGILHSWVGRLPLVFPILVCTLVLAFFSSFRLSKDRITHGVKIFCTIMILMISVFGAFFIFRQIHEIGSMRFIEIDHVEQMTLQNGRQRIPINDLKFRRELLSGIRHMVPLYFLNLSLKQEFVSSAQKLTITLQNVESLTFLLNTKTLQSHLAIGILTQDHYYQSRRLYSTIRELIKDAPTAEEAKP